MQVVLSVPYTTPWPDSTTELAEASVTFVRRRSDWNAGKVTRVVNAVADGRALWRASRRADAVVVCTAMLDALVVAAMFRFRRRTTLALWDFLLPRKPLARRAARRVLKRVDCWLTIRRGDADVFRRDLGAISCRFVAFPCETMSPAPDVNDRSVYAAGSAHRDWETLVEAAASIDGTVVISTNDPVTVPSHLLDRVRVIPMLSPEKGRERMSNASVICVPFQVTDLPCGPVVLLDAMAMGKPVVTTDVSGSRDYIEHDTSGILVRPRDAEAMATALNRVLNSETLRWELGKRARQQCEQFGPVHGLQAILDGIANERGLPRTRRLNDAA